MSEENTVSLREHLEALINGVKDNAKLALDATDKAIQKAENAADRRAADSNGRLDKLEKTIIDRLDGIDKALATGAGNTAGVKTSVATIVQALSSIGVLLGMVYLVLNGIGQ